MNLMNFDSEKIDKASEIFKGFGNPIRIRIIDALRDRSLRVMELSDLLELPQPIISQQLKILKSAGIVHRIREKHNYRYELIDPHFSEIIQCIKGCLKI